MELERLVVLCMQDSRLGRICTLTLSRMTIEGADQNIVIRATAGDEGGDEILMTS